MNARLKIIGGTTLVLLSTLIYQPSTALAQGTAFTYQGRLNDGTSPANGIYDLRFTIYDSPGGGLIVGGPLTNAPTGASNGLFTVTLDFGSGVFTGPARWLEIGVRTNGSVTVYQALSPRQPLTATPYAATAGNVTGVVGSSSLSGTYSNAVTLNNAGNSFTGSGAGLTSLSASQLTSGTVPAAALGNAWQTGGNSGTSPTNGNFLGTMDNQPLELKVNSQRVVRWERNTNAPIFGFIVPNIVSGHESNAVADGVGGATIAGGGGFAWYGSTSPQTVNASFGTIGGGVGNVVLGVVSTVAGGERGFIGTNAYNAFLGGGARNSIEGPDATIGGGTYNSIQPDAYNAFLGGGNNNSIQTNAGYSVLGGGYNNSIQPNASSSFLGGGNNNSIQTNAGYSVLGGGYLNVIRSPGAEATIAGGAFNTAIGSGVTIGGGYGNTCIASSNYYYATVAGGSGNTANGYGGTVGGGGGNSAFAEDTTVAGGGSNTSSNFAATVGGGFANQSTGNNYSTIAGGGFNISSGDSATVGGGQGNTSSGFAATVGGGFINHGSASYATVPGGYANYAGADFSFAAGTVAQANHSGSFVWSDASDFLGFSSITPNEFAVRVKGGARFVTGGTGMTLDGQAVLTASALNNLNAANITSGTLADARLSGNVALLSSSLNTFAGDLSMSGGAAYHNFSLSGGNAAGYLYGSYPHWGDGVHLGYNYYADSIGGSHFSNLGGGTSRISVGYNSIVLATGDVGVQPNYQNIVVNGTVTTVNGTLTVNGLFNNFSDRNAKRDFSQVSPSQILGEVLQLPISEWSYKDDPTTRHVGPVAQDFYGAFKIGTDDRHIAPIDEGGVALAAIQGLNQKLEQKETEITELKQRLDTLERIILKQRPN